MPTLNIKINKELKERFDLVLADAQITQTDFIRVCIRQLCDGNLPNGLKLKFLLDIIEEKKRDLAKHSNSAYAICQLDQILAQFQAFHPGSASSTP